MKKEFRTESIWAKIRRKNHLTDVLYGIRDRTENHGHVVISAGEMIYQRQISGANLSISGSELFLNNNLFYDLGFR